MVDSQGAEPSVCFGLTLNRPHDAAVVLHCVEAKHAAGRVRLLSLSSVFKDDSAMFFIGAQPFFFAVILHLSDKITACDSHS